MSPHSSTPLSEQSASTEATLETARKLVEQLTITSGDWHRLKGNRRARALEQASTAIVFLLNNHTEEGLIRLQQAVGWLDRSISAPPCPTHGHGSQGKPKP
nr:DUF6439 family protein [Acaryochloris sp. IP29b_bin.137]